MMLPILLFFFGLASAIQAADPYCAPTRIADNIKAMFNKKAYTREDASCKHFDSSLFEKPINDFKACTGILPDSYLKGMRLNLIFLKAIFKADATNCSDLKALDCVDVLCRNRNDKIVFDNVTLPITASYNVSGYVLRPKVDGEQFGEYGTVCDDVYYPASLVLYHCRLRSFETQRCYAASKEILDVIQNISAVHFQWRCSELSMPLSQFPL